MKYFVASLFILSHGLALAQNHTNPPMEGFDARNSDPQAIEIADKVMAEMGGRDAWDQARYLSWSLFGQDHVWDKWTGEFRWQGDSTVVLMNILSREGTAYINGDEAQHSEDHLFGAYRDWINAGYWLMMPFKLKDSGVTLGYKGESTMSNGEDAYVLTLSFEDVGMTPQNRYDVYVDKVKNLVYQWSFYSNSDADEPNFIRTWEGYKNYGGILLADARVDTKNPSNIRKITNLGVYSNLPESVFEDPEWMDLSTLQDYIDQ